jgi:hypothetical protein
MDSDEILPAQAGSDLSPVPGDPAAAPSVPAADLDEPDPGATPALLPTPPPPGRGWRFGRRARIATLAVAVAALIAGVVVWAPWTPSPPTGVHATSPTATTAVISWTASSSAFGPDHYLVLRDGTQVGSVPGSATSYTDHGLVPGTTYHYTVVAAGLANSGPSAKATVRAATPSPAGLAASQVTHTTVTLNWSPPPNAPTPDHYVIYNETSVVTTVPGTTTSYTDKTQTAGTPFQYDVVAQWGSASSAPSAAARGQTVAPPLSSVFNVQVKYASVPGNGWTSAAVGYSWTDQWSAAPACNAGSCNLTITLSLIPPGGYGYQEVYVAMHPSGSGGEYSGSSTAKVTYCGGKPPAGTAETDTFTMTMAPARGSVRNGAWGAWSGTVVLTAPTVYLAAGYCPGGTWTLALKSQ